MIRHHLIRRPTGVAPISDIFDIHKYPGPEAPPRDDDRVRFIGEFGGTAGSYLGMEGKLSDAIRDGVAGSCFVQATDVGHEDGFVAADRRRVKVDVAAIAAMHTRLARTDGPGENRGRPDVSGAGGATATASNRSEPAACFGVRNLL